MNTLNRIAEFREALQDYSLSKVALHTLSQTKLVLLVAPSSSGRNTVLREVVKTGDYHFIVSDTTRKPRENDGMLEQNGREYWFRTEDEVLADIQQGHYLEAAIIHEQQVSGISVRELELAAQEGKIAITDAEIAGADNAKKYKPDAIIIFVLPPSFEEWQRRLKHRGHMEPGEFKRRMESAAEEFRHALEREYYTFVINDKVSIAASKINSLAKLEAIDVEDQTAARNLAEQLLVSTEALLKTLT
jgi:guanylate kinase